MKIDSSCSNRTW